MSQLLISFLRNSKSQVVSEAVNIFHIVIGNQSCDLDSAVCALCLACHFHHITPRPSVAYIPVLNINRLEYKLKTEVTHTLQNAGIYEDILTFKDQLDLKKLIKDKRLEVTLVDWNKCTDELDSCVMRVIDHHVNKRNDKADMLIEAVGSCATLVAEVIMRQDRTQHLADLSCMSLLYAAILIDTSCLRNAAKTTQKDIDVVKRIEKLFPSLDRERTYGEVVKAKNDVGHLSSSQLLLKDLKQLHLDDGSKRLSVCFSSILLTPEEFFCKEVDILKTLHSFADEEDSQVLLLMFIAQDKPLKFLALFSPYDAILRKMIDILTEHKQPSLELSRVTSSGVAEGSYRRALEAPNVAVFRQGNLAASRKIVLPLIEEHLPFLIALLP